MPREPQRPREAASLDGRSCRSPGARATVGGTATTVAESSPPIQLDQQSLGLDSVDALGVDSVRLASVVAVDALGVDRVDSVESYPQALGLEEEC